MNILSLQVTFNVTMTVTTKACEGHTGVIERSVDIAAVGLAEKLTINLKIACDCDCEGPSVRVSILPFKC